MYIARKANLREFLCSEEQMCGTHKETKTIFCREEESLLCQLCSDSPEHKAHRYYSIKEAVEEQQVSDGSGSTLKGGDRMAKGL